MADAEHFTGRAAEQRQESDESLSCLVPMPDQPSRRKKLQRSSSRSVRAAAAGQVYATAKLPYRPRRSQTGAVLPIRSTPGGAARKNTHFKAFLSTTDRDEVETLTEDFPKRWHVEEFFNAHQALGWDRAGTCNLNIRFGHMTMALIAQAAIGSTTKKVASARLLRNWDAEHLAKAYFAGLEGDVRVDTGYDHRDVLQRTRCRQVAGMQSRGPAGQSSERKTSTRGFHALYGFKLRFSLPVRSN